MSDLADEELAELFLEDTEEVGKEAAEELIKRVTPRLYRFARDRGLPPDAAEDFVQEMLLRIWRNISTEAPTFQEPGSFMSWVLRHARWYIIDLHRKSSAHLRREEKPAVLEFLQAPDELGVKRVQIIDSFLSRVERELGQGARRILELKIGGLSSGEIADGLEISASALERSLDRTRQLLRDHLAKLRADSTSFKSDRPHLPLFDLEGPEEVHLVLTTYRRRKGRDTWDWCKNCSNWPTSHYDEITTSGRPSFGELCNECLAKEKKGTCSN